MLSVLAVEIDGMTLRAAVIRRNFKGFTVSDCLKIDRAGESDLITAEELSMLTSRIARCPKNAVVISPLAVVIEVAMDKKRVRKMRPYQLKEALRWEAEPYMTIPAAESLVGYELGLDTGEGNVELWVSMMPEEDYRSLKETFAGSGLKLKKVYPPDVCFPVAAMPASKRKDRVVVDLGRQTMKAALIEDGEIATFRTLPTSLAATRAHLDGLPAPELESSLKDIFAAWDIAGREVVLTGPGGLDADIVDFFRNGLGFNAAALELPAGAGGGPEYASVTGAGLRQLRVFGGWKTVGLDDGVDLGLLIRQRVQILPVVAVLMVVVLFLGHYFYLRNQLDRAGAEVGALTAQKEAYTRLQGEAAELENQVAALKQKAEFIEGHALDSEKILLLLLSVAARSGGGGEISRLNVQYLPGDQISLEGQGMSPASVDLLALTMQKETWCKHAMVESITREETTETVSYKMFNLLGEEEVGTTELEKTVYKFKIKVSVDRQADLNSLLSSLPG